MRRYFTIFPIVTPFVFLQNAPTFELSSTSAMIGIYKIKMRTFLPTETLFKDCLGDLL